MKIFSQRMTDSLKKAVCRTAPVKRGLVIREDHDLIFCISINVWSQEVFLNLPILSHFDRRRVGGASMRVVKHRISNRGCFRNSVVIE